MTEPKKSNRGGCFFIILLAVIGANSDKTPVTDKSAAIEAKADKPEETAEPLTEEQKQEIAEARRREEARIEALRVRRELESTPDSYEDLKAKFAPRLEEHEVMMLDDDLYFCGSSVDMPNDWDVGDSLSDSELKAVNDSIVAMIDSYDAKVEEVKSIPASNAYDNYKGYEFLSCMKPDSKKFAAKLEHYKAAYDAEQAELARIKDIKNDVMSGCYIAASRRAKYGSSRAFTGYSELFDYGSHYLYISDIDIENAFGNEYRTRFTCKASKSGAILSLTFD